MKYNIGTLLYYRKLSPDEMKNIPKSFSTISDLLKPSSLEREIIDKVLSKEGITLEDFSIKNETGSFFVPHEREVILKVSDLAVSSPEVDELNDRGNKTVFKIKISFSLQKGSYATIITKRIFGH